MSSPHPAGSLGARGRAVVPRLLLSHAFAATALSIPWPFMLVEVHARVGNGWLLGVVGAARLLPGLTLSWATGRLADRWSRSLIVRVTLWVRIVLLGAAAVALQADLLIVAVVLATLAVAVATPAYPALAAAMPGISGQAGDRATGLLVTVEVASFAVGPAVGGLLLPTGALGVGIATVAGTALGLVMFAGIRLLTPAPGAPAELTAYPLHHLVTVAGPVRRAVGLMGAINAVMAGVGIALITLAIEGWDGDDASYGLAAALLGFGSLAGPLLNRTGRTNAARMAHGSTILGALVLAVAVSPSLAWAILPLALAGAAAVQAESAATGLLQDNLPGHQLAGVLGAADSVMIGAALGATLATPILTDRFGATTVIAGCGIVMVICARGMRRSVRSARVEPIATRAADPTLAAWTSPATRISRRPGTS